MIDTHCHLLPGLDDGARSLFESIRMARRLADAGVEHVVCTPHFSPRFRTDCGVAAAGLDRLAAALAELDVSLRLSLGAEVDPKFALSAPIDELRARALAPGFVLVELLPDTGASVLDQISARLADTELCPVVAHPERCRAVQLRPALIDRLRESGGLVQIVAPSLTGSAEAPVGRTAWGLIEDGRADVVASDGHRPESSRLRLGTIAELVAGRVGTATATELFVNGPRRLLQSQYSRHSES